MPNHIAACTKAAMEHAVHYKPRSVSAVDQHSAHANATTSLQALGVRAGTSSQHIRSNTRSAVYRAIPAESGDTVLEPLGRQWRECAAQAILLSSIESRDRWNTHASMLGSSTALVADGHSRSNASSLAHPMYKSMLHVRSLHYTSSQPLFWPKDVEDSSVRLFIRWRIDRYSQPLQIIGYLDSDIATYHCTIKYHHNEDTGRIGRQLLDAEVVCLSRPDTNQRAHCPRIWTNISLCHHHHQWPLAFFFFWSWRIKWSLEYIIAVNMN